MTDAAVPLDASEPPAGGLKLGVSIALTAIVGAVVAAGLCIGLQLGYSAYRAEREAMERLIGSTDLLTAPLAATVAAGDERAAAAWLGLMEAHASAVAARVVLADGTTFATWGDPNVFMAQTVDGNRTRSDRRLSRVSTRLDEARNLGGFEVAYAPHRLVRPFSADAGFAVFAVIAAATIAASISLLAARGVARPFEEVLEQLREASENPTARTALQPQGVTELRELIGYINGMLAHVLDRGAAADDLVERLRDARDLADAANAAKTRFLAHMSHELRTPLNAIMGYTKFVAEDLEGPEHEQSRDDLARVTRASEHLLDLINQVLDLSKIEAGGLELDLAGFDVGAVVRQVVETSEPLAARSSNTLTLQACPKGEVIVTDALRLRQCLLNVLGNALKFTRNGRVDVSARIEKVDNERRFVCEIRDTGPGIPADRVDAIFEPFVQVEDGRGGPRQGTGLGLAITKRLCVALGGDVVCESELARGSVFTVVVRDLADLSVRRAA
jgi:signal transduction histidine kinase